MTEVKVVGEDIERAIKRFKRDTQPILRELRLRRGFESKPEKKKRKSLEARRRAAKMMRRRQEIKRAANR